MRLVQWISLPVLLFAGAAQAGSRQQATVLLSEDPGERKFQQDWGYADAVIVGDTVYLSGVVAGLRDGETDLKLAYDRAFARIGKVLERSGASWDDVVDITSFHTDLTTQMPAIVAVADGGLFEDGVLGGGQAGAGRGRAQLA